VFNPLVAIAGGLTSVVALVNDILVPQAWLAVLVAVVAGAGLLVSVIPARRWPALDEFARRRLPNGYWRLPIVASLALVVGISAVAYGVSSSAPPGGWVGTQVPVVHDWQQSWGIIKEQTAQIAVDTGQIREDTDEIKEKASQILDDTGQIRDDVGAIASQIAGTKQETSEDPRKELANLGVQWSTGAFAEALRTGDYRAVELFLAGEMSPTVLHEGASGVLYALEPGTPDQVAMLEVVIAGGFDPEELVFDDSGVLGYDDCCFQSEDMTVMSWGQFQGPLLMWLAVREAYGRPDTSDISVIEYLLDLGVDTTITKAYLLNAEYAFGDYPSFQAARDAIVNHGQ
jgi:hypothetical protein